MWQHLSLHKTEQDERKVDSRLCVCGDAKQKDKKQQSEVAAKKITVGYGGKEGWNSE